MFLKISSVLFLSALLSSCVVAVNTDDWDDERWHSSRLIEAERLSTLTMGVTQTSLLADWGEPVFSEAFIRGQKAYSVLFYRTMNNDHDGNTTRDETMPLVFVDGKLVGWGESAIEHAMVE